MGRTGRKDGEPVVQNVVRLALRNTVLTLMASQFFFKFIDIAPLSRGNYECIVVIYLAFKLKCSEMNTRLTHMEQDSMRD